MEALASNELHAKPAWPSPQQVTQVHADREGSLSAYQLVGRATAYRQGQPSCDSQWVFIKTSLMFVALTRRETQQPGHARCLWEITMCLAQPRAVSASNLTLGSCSQPDEEVGKLGELSAAAPAILPNSLHTRRTEGQMWSAGMSPVYCHTYLTQTRKTESPWAGDASLVQLSKDTLDLRLLRNCTYILLDEIYIWLSEAYEYDRTCSSILYSLKHLHALDKCFINSSCRLDLWASLPRAIQLSSRLPLPTGNFMIIYVGFLLFHNKYT